MHSFYTQPLPRPPRSDIDPRGFGPFSAPYPSNMHSFDHPEGKAQIFVARQWLREEGIEHIRGLSTYEAKHKCERWAQALGLANYISNGAMIMALIAEGWEGRLVRIDDSPNAWIR